jgi:hypothetical protein
MPTTMVSRMEMFCLPGRTSRARAPMTAPMTIAVMMPSMVVVLLQDVGTAVGRRRGKERSTVPAAQRPALLRRVLFTLLA